MPPVIIQGGMGAGVSNWVLARAVSRRGHLGVVSGTAMDAILLRTLADGDPGGHYRRALEAFPIPKIAEDILDRFFKAGGRADGEPYPNLPLHRRVMKPWQDHLIVLANFAEVFLAKEGHDGDVGINLLTKIQIPNLPSLYGAMLAGVTYVLMGAGIPKEIPGALDLMALHEPATVRLEMQSGTGADDEVLTFDPMKMWGDAIPIDLTRPAFLPIVASNSLATMLARKSTGRIDGFIIEGPTAGGHNAPPRGGGEINERGEPVYGDRDVVDLAKIAEIGLPFWLAGGVGSPEGLQVARAAGAAGIQVGTLFAFTEESGVLTDLKHDVVSQVRNGGVDVLTDGRASPTGFPFKAVELAGTISQPGVYESRTRVCDLGYLRSVYRREDGRLDYRCASEPVGTFVKKGGDIAETVGRKCLCNALLANIGLGQVREDGARELPLLTSGDELKNLGRFLGDRDTYSADDVLDFLLS